MRISTNQLFQSGVSAMQRAQTEMSRTSLQMATGRRILTPSDDPSGATQSVMLQAAVNKTEQYQRNADFALPKLELEESQIDAVQNYLQRARELVVAGSNDTYNDENRKTLADEIRQIRDAILGVANSQDSNGEYLFSGTDSFTQPFEANAAGRLVYVGAEGTGAVREVAITSTRNIQVGDTGKSVFMSAADKSGWEVEGIAAPGNTGTVTALETQVVDKEVFDLNPEKVYTIEFQDVAGTLSYAVYDSSVSPAVPVTDESGAAIEGPYENGMTIEFAGINARLGGDAQVDDEITVRPAEEVSIFDTLDAIATTFETPSDSDEEAGVTLEDAVAKALLNIDSGLDRTNEVRTSVGLRISDLETQSGLNDQRVLDLETTLSEIRDLDYAEAISRFKLQEVVLQAAQQSYVQVSRLSLFDFL